MDEALLLTALFCGTAVLYSSVGHAGASGYLAVMGLVGLPGAVMKPTALVLNLFVASVVTIRFAAAGLVDWRRLAPFLAGSVPFAFLGGAVSLPGTLYRVLVGFVLVLAAARLLRTASEAGRESAIDAVQDTQGRSSRYGTIQPPPPRAPVAAGVGAGVGTLAGLTGTGGGIFLTPILLFAGWATTRMAAGMSAAFILANSAAGLAGNIISVRAVPASIPLWVAAVMVGALIGSSLGTHRLGTPALRRLLATVLLVAGLKLIVLP